MSKKQISKYGWYNFDYTKQGEMAKISNDVSEQSLTINNHQYISESVFKTTVSCVYKDNDIEQTIQLVISRIPNYGDELSGYHEIELHYDDFLPSPTYGYWRRLDDFLSDALLCWQGIKVSRVIFIGAWVGSEWSNEIKRAFLVINGIDFHGKPSEEKPALLPLTAQESHRWQLHDVDNPKKDAELEYALYEGTHVPYIPKTNTPSGFQGKVPYLARGDGNSFFVFNHASYDIHPYSDCSYINTYYTYIDEDVFFTFRNYGGRNELMSVSTYGFRMFPPDPSLWATRYSVGKINPIEQTEENLSQSMNLNYFIWLRVKHAFCDAWHGWRECKNRLMKSEKFNYRNTASFFEWDKAYGGAAEIEDGFVAGIAQRLVISYDYVVKENTTNTDDIQKLIEEAETVLQEAGESDVLAELRQRLTPDIPSDFPIDALEKDKIEWFEKRFAKELETLSSDPTAGEVNDIYQSYISLVNTWENPLSLDPLTAISINTKLDGILIEKKLAIPEKSTNRKKTTLEKSIEVAKSEIKEYQRQLRQEKLTPEGQGEITEIIDLLQRQIALDEENLLNLGNQKFVPDSFDTPEKSSSQLFKEKSTPFSQRNKYKALFIISLSIAWLIFIVITLLR